MRPVGRVYKSRSKSWSGGEWLHFTIGAVVIVLVVLFFYVVLHPAALPETNDAGCRVGQAPTSQTIILVDNTDAFSPSQIARFRKAVDDAHKKVSPWGMLTIASIGGELPPPDPLFARCSPEKGEIRILQSQDWLELKKKYEEEFQGPIKSLIDRMPFNKTTPYSPIIGTIEGVIGDLKSGGDSSAKRKLIIFSDLMENTPAFSQYGSLKTFSQARASVPYIRDLNLDLHNTVVTVYYLTGRPNNVPFQVKRHEKFWKDLIACYGGQIDEWVRVPMHSAS